MHTFLESNKCIYECPNLSFCFCALYSIIHISQYFRFLRALYETIAVNGETLNERMLKIFPKNDFFMNSIFSRQIAVNSDITI